MAGAATLVVAVAVWGGSLPTRQRVLSPPATTDGTVAGILHVHTTRSDGRLPPAAVAAAAQRAGLQFVVFTDHGDGTRAPDPPTYYGSVLALDGVEVSTTQGHYIAIGLPATPFALGGEPADVVDDVRYFGGVGIVAHPDSSRPSLRWTRWDLPIDGVELDNLDSAWRRRWDGSLRDRLLLGASLLSYWTRPAETVTRLADGEAARTPPWDSIARTRPLLMVAGADAHGGVVGDEGRGAWPWSIPVPNYDATFAALSVHVHPREAWTGHAAHDAAALTDGLRDRRAFVVYDGLATPASAELSVRSVDGLVHEGGHLVASARLHLAFRHNGPPEAMTVVTRNGHRVAMPVPGQVVEQDLPGEPGSYGVQVTWPGTQQRWLVMNPFTVTAQSERGTATAPTPDIRPEAWASLLVPPTSWALEHAPGTDASLMPMSEGLRFRYQLDDGPNRVAAVVRRGETAPSAWRAGLRLTAEAPVPTRVAVQVRADAGPETGHRWQRSLRLDTTRRTWTLDAQAFTPIDATRALADVRDPVSLLIVVDGVHSPAGATGTVTIHEVAVDAVQGPAAASGPHAQ